MKEISWKKFDAVPWEFNSRKSSFEDLYCQAREPWDDWVCGVGVDAYFTKIVDGIEFPLRMTFNLYDRNAQKVTRSRQLRRNYEPELEIEDIVPKVQAYPSSEPVLLTEGGDASPWSDFLDPEYARDVAEFSFELLELPWYDKLISRFF